MIDESIRTYFSQRSSSRLNFNGLLKFMESSSVNYHNRKVKGSMALATINDIYLDLSLIKPYGDILLYFIILHETAHHKRIQRLGKDKVIAFLSLEDFEEFFQHVIGEEIIADRYGCLTFRFLNGFSFPREATQQLHRKDKQNQYRNVAGKFFGVIKNSEENYVKLLESFLE